MVWVKVQSRWLESWRESQDNSWFKWAGVPGKAPEAGLVLVVPPKWKVFRRLIVFKTRFKAWLHWNHLGTLRILHPTCEGSDLTGLGYIYIPCRGIFRWSYCVVKPPFESISKGIHTMIKKSWPVLLKLHCAHSISGDIVRFWFGQQERGPRVSTPQCSGGAVARGPHSTHWMLRIRKAAVSHSTPGVGTCQKCNCQLSLCTYQVRSLGGSAVFEQAPQVVLLLHANIWEPLLCSRTQPSVTLYPHWAGSWTLHPPNVNEPSPLGHRGFIKKRLWFSFSILAIKNTLFLHDSQMVINPTHYFLFNHRASQSPYNKGAGALQGHVGLWQHVIPPLCS